MFNKTQWFLKELERRDRAHEAHVEKLLDRIMHLVEKPMPIEYPRVEEDLPDPYLDVLDANSIPYPDL